MHSNLMLPKIEKIATYCVGCVSGAIAAIILLIYQIPGSDSTLMSNLTGYWFSDGRSEYFWTVIISGTIIGFLSAYSLITHGKAKSMSKNNILYNEAVSLISHQMRTSLTVANWGIEIILKNYRGKLAKPDEEMLNTIIDEIRNISLQSVNLLDIATSDTSRITVSFELLSLSEVEKIARDVSDKFKHAAEKQSDKLEAEIKLSGDVKIQVDPLRLRFIMENILENALHYGGGGGKSISLNVSNDNDVLRIMVSDNGIGIPLAEQENVFTKFYRASNARGILNTGTGIGLYLCKEYVSIHNGKIGFESIPGKGTTFLVELPLKDHTQVNEFFNKI